MATPVLIDTDMTLDSTVGVALALASDALDVRAVVAVGGPTSLAQSVGNIARFLDAIKPPRMPMVGIGLEASNGGILNRRPMCGADGLGDWNQPAPANIVPERLEKVYSSAADAADGELTIIALGPLTNLAGLLESSPEVLRKAQRIVVCGGTLRLPGNAGKNVEFNFHRDPIAASRIFNAGLPITLVPLDVTHLVCLDQSHIAHLAAGGYRTSEVPAKLLEFALEFDGEPAYGKTFIPSAVAVGCLLWPQLFMKTRMGVQVTPDGPSAGRVTPGVGLDKSHVVDVLTAINAVDFLENLLESLCHEAFIV